MAFISVGFYLFVAAMVAVYYLFPLRWRWVVLLGASMGFYCYLSAFSAANITMLLAAALLAWILALWQRRWPRYKRLWLTLAVAASAIPLLIIKEMPFFLSRVVYRARGHRLLLPATDRLRRGHLPRHDLPPAKLLQVFAVRQLFPQLVEGHRFDERTFVKGFMLILWGFFLKLCIADKAAIVVNMVFDNYPLYSGIYVLVAGILYSFQLYTDFLACTTLAQGVAGLVGIQLMDNFRRGLLEAVAHFPQFLAAGLYLYPPGRQPKGDPAQIREPADRLCRQRDLARRRL